MAGCKVVTCLVMLALLSKIVHSFNECVSPATPITELRKEGNNCTDPNAEYRSDNASCVVTCKKPSVTENPAFCFANPVLTQNCYCKQNFYLNEATGRCVSLPDCPCNATNIESSRFSNECGNNCATFHTLSECPKLLKNQCWCNATYCKDERGVCVPKEDYFKPQVEANGFGIILE